MAAFLAPAPALRGFLGALLLVAPPVPGPRPAAAQNDFFEVLEYRGPTQCERMQCLSVRLDYCREHSEGFYLKEKGCLDGKICTDCTYGNITHPTRCRCENPPYTTTVTYGQQCNQGQICGPGEGVCYRPCYTYLHSTQCPSLHCHWQQNISECVAKPASFKQFMWMHTDLRNTPEEQGDEILEKTEGGAFPIGFEHFKESANGYRIRGKLINNITKLESLFQQLDQDNNGELNQTEYMMLPGQLTLLEGAVASMEHAALQSANEAAQARRLQGNSSDEYVDPEASSLLRTISPEICNAQRPRAFYCSFDETCKQNCTECGWKTAADRAFSTCIVPSTDACWADNMQVYCPSDELCHPTGDCSNCVDRDMVDHSQHLCVHLWWDPEPLPQWTNWVCRHRNKVGMPCLHDQDCINGMKRCLQGYCQPFQPYNPDQNCTSDHDCPHLGYYCPDDPTGGLNPYWITYCRHQREDGMTCSEDRECKPELRCNLGEPQPRCRKLYSLVIGAPANIDELCLYGWRDRDGKCAPPAKSKQVGRPCDLDSDCVTTDTTGRSGNCVCKAWWEFYDAKYCAPVAGDFERHQEKLRNYLYFKAANCGSFWTEEECLRVFGNAALSMKLEVECEIQQLSGGPYNPPERCGIVDDVRFGDKCEMLARIR